MHNNTETTPTNTSTRRRKGRRSFQRQVWTLSVIVSLVLSVLALNQNPAAASETDGVDISCPSGMTLDEATTTCRSTTSSNVAPETKTVYTCPDDYTEVAGTSGKDLECENVRIGRNPNIVKTDKWACPTGSSATSGSGATLKCAIQTTRTVTAAAVVKTTYSCATGFVLRTTPRPSCTKTTIGSRSLPVTVTTTYTCSGPSIKVGSGASTTCVTIFGVPIPPNVTRTYKCPAAATSQTGSGASLRCFQRTSSIVQGTVVTRKTYSCPTGYTARGTGALTTCSKKVPVSNPVAALKTTTYSCPAGSTAKGSGPSIVCEIKIVKQAPPVTTTEYFCPDGSVAVDGTNGADLECRVTTGTEVPATVTCGDRTVTVNMNKGEKPTRGHDVILGTQGPDNIKAKKGDDIICGWGGNDTIKAGGGDDTIFAGNGNDKVKAGGGKDTIYGGQDNDILEGGGGKDVINGGNGDDAIDGGKGKDLAYGEGGNDSVNGGGGRDTLHGGDGVDSCDGGPGKNKIGATCES